MSKSTNRNHGWTVTFAGTGINLALGVLYTWSIIAGGLDWSETAKSIPYSIAIGVFALTMIPAGRLQDKFSPKLTATIGGLLTGAGFLVCSLTGTFTGFIIGFGILAGVGIGFGYASATPPAIKWFPSAKTGLITGLVVSGFGLASVYIAPLARWMMGSFGMQTSMFAFGVGFLIIVVSLAQLLKNPPEGYVPVSNGLVPKSVGAAAAVKMIDVSPREMIRTAKFWLLWTMFACGSGAGLMIIGKLKPIVKSASEIAWFATLCLALLAVGNAAGRIIAGILSDKIGRTMTMFLIFIVQAGVMVALIFLSNVAAVLYFLSFLAGFNYGANLSVFPSVTKDLFGLKNFGMNYGIMFTAWGFGGVILPIVAGKVVDVTGNFNIAYIIAAVCLAVAAVLSLVVRTPKQA